MHPAPRGGGRTAMRPFAKLLRKLVNVYFVLCFVFGPRHLGRTSPKLHISCRVGRKTFPTHTFHTIGRRNPRNTSMQLGYIKRRRGRTLRVVGEDVRQVVERVLVFRQLAELIEIGQSHLVRSMGHLFL